MIEKELKNIDFNGVSLDLEYDQCEFINCNFTGVNLSQIKFVECSFDACNFSQTKWTGTSAQSCKFIDCKMLGIDFSNVNPFLLGMAFENCQLNLASFYALKLKQGQFVNCDLSEVDFVETDLTKANFSGSRLKGASFDNSVLVEADFRTSEGFSIDPTKNRIRKAKFAKDNVLGLLDGFGVKIE